MKKNYLFGALLTVLLWALIIVWNTNANAQDTKATTLLADSAYFYNWSGSKWDTVHMEKYQHNINGDMTLTEGFNYNFGSQNFADTSYRVQFMYNNQNQLTEELSENHEGNNWQNAHKQTWVYNNDTLLLVEKELDWSGSQWDIKDGDSTYYELDNQDRLDYFEEYEYDTLAAQWQIRMKIWFKQFNAGNEPTEAMMYEWDDDQAEWDSMKITNVQWRQGYNFGKEGENDEPSDMTMQGWDEGSSTWKEMMRKTSVITNELLMSELMEMWVEDSVKWFDAEKATYTYNTNNRLTQKLQQGYDVEGDQWFKHSEQLQYSYSAQNQVTYESEEYWEDGQQKWGERHTYTRGQYGEELTDMSEYFYPGVKGAVEWTKQDSITYFYDYTTIGVYKRQNSMPNITIYPNPVKDELHLQSNLENLSVEVLNITGQKVAHYSNISKSINLEKLDAGVYFVNIYSAKGRTTHKILKE